MAVLTRFAACVLAGCLVLGCSRGPSLVPVSGTVTVDGKPLQAGAVLVAPMGGRAAGGRIGADGRFTLSTWQPEDGVVAGSHRVEVIATKPISWLLNGQQAGRRAGCEGPWPESPLRVSTAR